MKYFWYSEVFLCILNYSRVFLLIILNFKSIYKLSEVFQVPNLKYVFWNIFAIQNITWSPSSARSLVVRLLLSGSFRRSGKVEARRAINCWRELSSDSKFLPLSSTVSEISSGLFNSLQIEILQWKFSLNYEHTFRESIFHECCGFIEKVWACPSTYFGV